MVYKKYQVYDWFKTLDGAKRIDFLNGILHLCFPLELRFLGSCIEELARKDFIYLRDAELKANSLQEIHLMHDLSDKITRSKMIVTLALLSSNNFDCAQLLYDMLNIDMADLLDHMRASLNLDTKIADEFLLMLTMAANHPAFNFQMKTRMSQLYLLTEQKLKVNRVVLRESESDMHLFEEFANPNNTNVNEFNPNSEVSSSFVENNNHANSNNNCGKNNDINKPFLTTARQTSQNDHTLVLNYLNNTTAEQLNVDTNNNMNNEFNVDSIGLKRIKPIFTTSSSTSSLVSNTSIKEHSEHSADNFIKPKKPESVENLPVKDETSNSSVKSAEVRERIDTGSEEGLDEPLIEAINFEGVQNIKGTDTYKFIIKVYQIYFIFV